MLVDGIKSHKPQDTLGETQSIAQGNTSSASIGLTEVENEEHTSKEGHQVSHKISTEGQPSIAGPQVDKGSTLDVDLLKVVPDESSLVTISSDSGHAAECFAELLEQGTALDGFKSLEIARSTEVEDSDEVEQHRNTGGGEEEVGCDVRNKTNSHQKRNATADDANGDGCNLLVNSLQILAETVHQLTKRGDIKELELGSGHRCDQSVVNALGGSQRAQEYPEISEQSRKSTGNTDDSKNSQVVHGINVLVSGLQGDLSVEGFSAVVCGTHSNRISKGGL